MFCHNINHHPEEEVNSALVSRKHSSQDTQSDLLKVVAELEKAEVFKVIPNRAHPSFPNDKSDIFNDFPSVVMCKEK